LQEESNVTRRRDLHRLEKHDENVENERRQRKHISGWWMSDPRGNFGEITQMESEFEIRGARLGRRKEGSPPVGREVFSGVHVDTP
jgi:hypothetical protein